MSRIDRVIWRNYARRIRATRRGKPPLRHFRTAAMKLWYEAAERPAARFLNHCRFGPCSWWHVDRHLEPKIVRGGRP